jgi:hypothetical protein
MPTVNINYQNKSHLIHTRLSFKPLLNRWKEKAAVQNEGCHELYSNMLHRLSRHPELLEPIDDMEVVNRHKSLIGMMMASIFPVTISDDKDLFAVTIPFTYTSIYSSSFFKALFLPVEGGQIMLPDEETEKLISESRLISAYQIILNRFYGMNLSGTINSVYSLIDPATGLKKFLELDLDASFIEVVLKGDLPNLEQCPHCSQLTDLLKIPNLQELLPLELFEFQGMVIINIKDVTEREVISEIKNRLLSVHSFADTRIFESLQEKIQQLLGFRDIRIGIAPFFKVNNHFVFSEHLIQNSFLLKKAPSFEEKAVLTSTVNSFFATRGNVLIPEITETLLEQFPLLSIFVDNGGKSIIICPLKSGNELIGMLSVLSESKHKFGYEHLTKIEQAIPLFVLAMEKSAEHLVNQVDRVIKEQFTAVQSSVEWKFTEAALDFLESKNKEQESKIENIVFDNVYPLYGAIDIRNSSVERSQAIQKDLLEQLRMTAAVIYKAQKTNENFPLLNQIIYRIDKYIYTVSNILFSGDELEIHSFLHDEIVQLFQHLRGIIPTISTDIDEYFTLLDSNFRMLYLHRKQFEESITKINFELAKYIDKQQAAAQKIFPHYFERFITDGVDFNIYIGQSITPGQSFDHFYLKNLKIWQLTTLAGAARMTKKLEANLNLPLSTTQLILAHSNSISISFRAAERKFDVDGAYNIRYEIMKKRIDKVRIKDTNERLTQPGKIAIVYSQSKEANEYAEYIEFLQKQGLFTGETERYDLEELQGVSGLKALRVSVALDEEPAYAEATAGNAHYAEATADKGR